MPNEETIWSKDGERRSARRTVERYYVHRKSSGLWDHLRIHGGRAVDLVVLQLQFEGNDIRAGEEVDEKWRISLPSSLISRALRHRVKDLLPDIRRQRLAREAQVQRRCGSVVVE